MLHTIAAQSPDPVHYLPIATTIIAAAFIVSLLTRAAQRNWPPHLLWWAVGVFFYGVGTGVESIIALTGNTELLNRTWYWAGAILGGYPLATGTVYLLCPRKTAHWLTGVSLVYVAVISALVWIAPVYPDLIPDHKPLGRGTFAWEWLPWTTLPINGYAALFLIGGAIYSSVRFLVSRYNPQRAAGTALIALGALLPGVGGAMAKAGNVEALYVGEFTGLIIIWIGYAVCLRAPAPIPQPTPHERATTINPPQTGAA